VAAAPVLFIVTPTVLCFNFFGDGLRDAADPYAVWGPGIGIASHARLPLLSVPVNDREPTDSDSLWLTRATLLHRVRDPRDEASWTEFVRYYERFVYAIARRMNLNHHDAEEVVQTVILKLWKKIPEFEYDASKGRFRGWLCTVAGNEVKRLLRRRSAELHRLENRERDLEESYLNGIQVSELEAAAEKEWIVYIATLAWERVQPHFESHVLAAFERLSKGENAEAVARDLGIAPSSVYVYKKRVGDRLREEIRLLNNELD
jgi:RNA polymerase sigma factor (sigma-70 family)